MAQYSIGEKGLHERKATEGEEGWVGLVAISVGKKREGGREGGNRLSRLEVQ